MHRTQIIKYACPSAFEHFHLFAHLPLVHTITTTLNCHSYKISKVFTHSLHKNWLYCWPSLVYSINEAELSLIIWHWKPTRCKWGKVNIIYMCLLLQCYHLHSWSTVGKHEVCSHKRGQQSSLLAGSKALPSSLFLVLYWKIISITVDLFQDISCSNWSLGTIWLAIDSWKHGDNEGINMYFWGCASVSTDSYKKFQFLPKLFKM